MLALQPMKKYFLCGLLFFITCLISASHDQITVRAARVLDGKGKTIEYAVLTIEGSKIVSIAHTKQVATYELGNYTLLPGGVDTHVHISWHFDENGKTHDPEKEEESE